MVVLISEYQNFSMYQAMTLSKDVLAKEHAGQSAPSGPPRVSIILTCDYGLSCIQEVTIHTFDHTL